VHFAEEDLRVTLEELLGSRRRPSRIYLAAPFLGRTFGGWIASLAKSHRAADKRVIVCWEKAMLEHGLVSAVAAKALLDSGFQIYGLQGLHGKLVVVGSWAYVGSANLTERGLGGGNHELGVVLSNGDAETACTFFSNWAKAAQPVKDLEVERWARREHQKPPQRLDKEVTAWPAAAKKMRRRPPDTWKQYVQDRRLSEAIHSLEAKLQSDPQSLHGVRATRMHRDAAYRDAVLLRITDDDPMAARKAKVLLEVLEHHPDQNARAHAAYRLGFDPAPEARRSTITRSLRRAEQDQSRVVRRAASRSLTHLNSGSDRRGVPPVSPASRPSLANGGSLAS
jgi:PLD-like domain